MNDIKYHESTYCPYGFTDCKEPVCIEKCRKYYEWLAKQIRKTDKSVPYQPLACERQ